MHLLSLYKHLLFSKLEIIHVLNETTAKTSRCRGQEISPTASPLCYNLWDDTLPSYAALTPKEYSSSGQSPKHLIMNQGWKPCPEPGIQSDRGHGNIEVMDKSKETTAPFNHRARENRPPTVGSPQLASARPR